MFWTGNTGREIRKKGQCEQLVALYLMTAPGATMLGVYHLPAVTLAHAIGSPYEGAMEALRSLQQLHFCTYDEESEWVWVHEMAKYQIESELDPKDNRVKSVSKDWLALPQLPFLVEFFNRYRIAFHLPERKPLGSPSEAPPKPRAGTRTRTRTELPPKSPKGEWVGFSEFWDQYPNRKGKAKALESWNRLEPDELLRAKIARALIAAKASVGWTKDGGQFVPMPATWLNGRRWEDEIADAADPAASGVGSLFARAC